MKNNPLSKALATALLPLALIILLGAPIASAANDLVAEGADVSDLAADPLGDKDSTEALCGAYNCVAPNVCVYCMGFWQCKPEGWTCCSAYWCSPDQECIYCMGGWQCKPIGYSCCTPYWCNPDQDCLYCNGGNGCYPAGSSCCTPFICTPTQKCEIGPGGTHRCVPA